MGYGKLLMTTLIDAAINQNMHVMIAGIDASNEGSIIFHKKFGFEEVAHFKEVGYKFNRWLDVIFMQKML
jgi:phosphinothricin acetyltransferase